MTEVKDRIRSWLREKPRSEDELIEKFYQAMSKTFDITHEHYKLKEREIMLERILAPVTTGYESGPWWRFW